ncbi:MAG: hypothetical protein GX157_08665 [Candidatus Cloacimonetes bacterium]|nr:hypothetical protein [Candidatus Cloacimonadota bacterium]
MTVQETILSFPGLYDFPLGFLPVILKGRSLNGAADSDDIEVEKIELAIADTLVYAVNMPDFTENKLSVKYSRSHYISTARSLYLKNGEPGKAASIGNKISVPVGKANNKW